LSALDESGTLTVEGSYLTVEGTSWHQRKSRSKNAHISCGSSAGIPLASQRLIGSELSESFGARRATRTLAGLRRAALAV
jgi:hypothetical protein